MNFTQKGKNEGGFSLKESRKTYVPGVRTSPIQYEENRTDSKKVEEKKPIYQPVRQGNKEYPVSPIYSQKINVEEATLSYNGYQQDYPILIPAELTFGPNEISDETLYGQMQESGSTLVKRRKPNDLSAKKIKSDEE